MGKEWYWSRSSRKINGSAEKENHHHHQVVGCMSGIFHLFNLHQLLFTARNVVADPVPSTSLLSSKFPENPRWKEEILKGVEAPRNSLELDITATATTTTPPSASAFEADDYEIPFGIEVVLKRKGNSSGEQMREERSLKGMSTARSSTANVVAKLMGLDALPNHQGFSSFSSRTYCYREEAVSLSPPLIGSQKQQCQSKKKKNQQQKKMDCSSRTGSQTPPPRHPLQPRNSNAMVEEDARRGTRSLPETPRMSFARRSWDSDPRLSVQSNCSTGTGNHYNNNKENVNVVNSMSASEMQELKCIFEDHSKSKATKAKSRTRDENGQRSSPSLYAKGIVRQMKDTVSRRIERGRTAETSETTTTTTTTTTATNKTPTPTASSSSSPPYLVETVEPDNGPVVVKSLSPPKQVLSSTTKITKNTKPKQKTPSPIPPPAKCKKVSCDRFNERLKKPPSVATASTSNAISVSSVLAQRKSKRTNKSPPPLPPPPPQIDIQVANPSLLQKQRESGGANKLPPVPEELQYVKRVLDKAGIGGHTSLPFTVRWNSSSHPLDPIIFHRLELTNTVHDGPLRHRCNRKLLFDLVDEILGDLLYPFLSDNMRRKRTAATTKMLDGESLLHQLWSRIRSFPAADCQVMQDIDALVESDIPASNIRQLLRHPAVEEEAEMIACEVERWLVDTLVVEKAALTATR